MDSLQSLLTKKIHNADRDRATSVNSAATLSLVAFRSSWKDCHADWDGISKSPELYLKTALASSGRSVAGEFEGFIKIGWFESSKSRECLAVMEISIAPM